MHYRWWSDRGEDEDQMHDSKLMSEVVWRHCHLLEEPEAHFNLTFKSCSFVTGITVVNVFTDGP